MVAREIRRLADQTAEATLDIEHIVKEMTSAVSAGVVGIDNFAHDVRQGEEIRTVGAHLAQIITQVQTLTSRFDTVHAGMQDQVQGAQQISAAMEQLQEVAEQAATSLHTAPGRADPHRATLQLGNLRTLRSLVGAPLIRQGRITGGQEAYAVHHVCYRE